MRKIKKKKNGNKRVLYFLLILFSISLASFFAVKFVGIFAKVINPNPIVLAFNPSNKNVNVGDIFEINISVLDVNSILISELDILYNSAVLQYQGFSEGSFFCSSGCFSSNVSSSGLIRDLIITRLPVSGVLSGVSGGGNIVILKFKAIAGGTSFLRINSSSEIYAYDGINLEQISFSSSDGNIVVSSLGCTLDSQCPSDGWYDSGNTRLISLDQCRDKEQKQQENRNYYCNSPNCNYTMLSTQWIDTLNIINKADNIPCSDGNLCTIGDKCISGACIVGAPKVCDDGKACSKNDSCDSLSGNCVYNVSGCSCIQDSDCPDNICNIGKCNLTSNSCYNDILILNGTSCTNLFCKINQSCTLGTCGLGIDRNCSDNNVTTYDFCDETNNICNNTLFCGDGKCSSDYESCFSCSSDCGSCPSAGGSGGGGSSGGFVTTINNAATCYENWVCTDWTDCVDESQTRICTDMKSCNSSIFKPISSKSCFIEQEEAKAPNIFRKVLKRISEYPKINIIIIVLCALIVFVASLLVFILLNKRIRRVRAINLIKDIEK